MVGGSSDIGRAVAVRLADAGCEIVVFGRDVAALEQTAERCRDRGVGATVVRCDVLEDASAVFERACRDAPPRHVVWAAGVFDWASAEVADAGVWAQLVEVNLVAAMRMTRAVLPGLVATGAGSLIYVASLAGLDVFANNAAYVASKHGLVAFAQAVFLDVREHGVKVCAVCPGLVDAGASRVFPAAQRERFLRADDVADAVLYAVTTSPTACPTQIRLEPQHDPHDSG